MIFLEKGIYAHSFLFIAGSILFIIFIIYIYICNHKKSITKGGLWFKLFRSHGLNDNQIKDITHDDDSWYYKNKNTCVVFGNASDICNRSQGYCSGNNLIGSPSLQVRSVVLSIKNQGEHKDCPLIYPGVN